VEKAKVFICPPSTSQTLAVIQPIPETRLIYEANGWGQIEAKKMRIHDDKMSVDNQQLVKR
jgi:hypothetical protein